MDARNVARVGVATHERTQGRKQQAFGLLAVITTVGVAAGIGGSLGGCQDDAYCFGCREPGQGGSGNGGGSVGGSGTGGVLFGGGTPTGGEEPCTADTANDVENCGACGHVCVLENAYSLCVGGECVIDECIAGAYDNDEDPATGCEYVCEVPEPGPEQCNGLDDDCDGLLDSLDPDLSAPIGFCNTTAGTPCEQTEVECAGELGWTCNYPAGVEVVAGFVRQVETQCDGIDGNCDGNVDEWFVDVGKPCSDGQLGQCRDFGVIVCDPGNAGRTTCDLSVLPDPSPPQEELCNGLDDDCDGFVDEELAASAFEMAPIPGTDPPVQVDRFEASRPDATDAVAGILETVACSNPNAVPWAGGSYSEAEAACAARGPGYRLCTAGELEQACRGGADTPYPYGQTYLPDACNGVDNPIAPQGAAPTGSLVSCAVGTPALYDLSGNVAEWTGTQTNASPAPGRIFQLHGGSYLSPVLGLACTVELAPRANEGTLLPNIGFRCCWANP